MRWSRIPSSAKHRRTLSFEIGIPISWTGVARTEVHAHALGGLQRRRCGPFTLTATKPGSTPLGLEEAHRDLHISPDEFDEVAAELGRSLDHFGVPADEKEEVLAAFAAHKGEATEGSMAS